MIQGIMLILVILFDENQPKTTHTCAGFKKPFRQKGKIGHLLTFCSPHQSYAADDVRVHTNDCGWLTIESTYVEYKT